jgi:hypothetical protein
MIALDGLFHAEETDDATMTDRATRGHRCIPASRHARTSGVGAGAMQAKNGDRMTAATKGR